MGCFFLSAYILCIRAQYSQSIQLSLIHISEPTRLLSISYAVFCLKKNVLSKQRIKKGRKKESPVFQHFSHPFCASEHLSIRSLVGFFIRYTTLKRRNSLALVYTQLHFTRKKSWCKILLFSPASSIADGLSGWKHIQPVKLTIYSSYTRHVCIVYRQIERNTPSIQVRCH